jgi:hypothetical protein
VVPRCGREGREQPALARGAPPHPFGMPLDPNDELTTVSLDGLDNSIP